MILVKVAVGVMLVLVGCCVAVWAAFGLAVAVRLCSTLSGIRH